MPLRLAGGKVRFGGLKGYTGDEQLCAILHLSRYDTLEGTVSLVHA